MISWEFITRCGYGEELEGLCGSMGNMGNQWETWGNMRKWFSCEYFTTCSRTLTRTGTLPECMPPVCQGVSIHRLSAIMSPRTDSKRHVVWMHRGSNMRLEVLLDLFLGFWCLSCFITVCKFGCFLIEVPKPQRGFCHDENTSMSSMVVTENRRWLDNRPRVKSISLRVVQLRIIFKALKLHFIHYYTFILSAGLEGTQFPNHMIAYILIQFSF